MGLSFQTKLSSLYSPAAFYLPASQEKPSDRRKHLDRNEFCWPTHDHVTPSRVTHLALFRVPPLHCLPLEIMKELKSIYRAWVGCHGQGRVFLYFEGGTVDTGNRVTFPWAWIKNKCQVLINSVDPSTGTGGGT